MESNNPTAVAPDVLIEPKTIGWLTFLVLGFVWFDFLLKGTVYGSLLEIIIFSIVTILLAISIFIPQFKYSQRVTTYLVIYHIVVASLLIWIVPLGSGFIYLWGLLLFLADHYHQLKGLVGSLLTLIIVVALACIFQHINISWPSFLKILPQIAVVVAVTLVLIRIVSGSRKRRSELAERVLQAQYEHQRLIALVNSMTEAVLAVNQAGVITIYNSAAMDLLDTNLDLADKNIADFIQLRDSDGKVVSLMKIAAETQYLSQRTDLIMPIGANDQINLEINISRTSLTSPLAKQQGYTFMLRDITQQKSLDVEREEFISVVSHELRTPIAIAEANVSVAQLIAAKPESDKVQVLGTLEKAHHQILFLSDMVNDLATLSRAERTDKEMSVEAFSLSEVINELDKIYGPQAEKKGLNLIIDADKELPIINSSKLYVKEIIQNFVTNAIKYTEKGNVVITAHAVAGNNFKISVRDSGIGIAKSEQDKVFQKFWRSEDPYTRKANGTGLGLYITAKLARRIGAQIDMESVLKSGSTFSLTLPTNATLPIDQKNVVKNEIDHVLE